MATTHTPVSQPHAEVDNLMSGAEYLESLRDAREVYIYGERVTGRNHSPCLPQWRPLHHALVRHAA